VADAARIRTLVTDRSAPEAELAALAAQGVEIVIAGADDDAIEAPAGVAGAA
jgi:hypothetical protein